MTRRSPLTAGSLWAIAGSDYAISSLLTVALGLLALPAGCSRDADDPAGPSGSSRTPLRTPTPLGAPPGHWIFVDMMSDEFNGAELDTMDKWNSDLNDWGKFSFEPENVSVLDGLLRIDAIYEPHTRDGSDTLYYKTGSIKTRREPILHGYFEIRMKAAARMPGVNTAFWLYRRDNCGDSSETWTEIDVIETGLGYWPCLDTNGLCAASSGDSTQRIDQTLHSLYHPRRNQNLTGVCEPSSDNIYSLKCCRYLPQSPSEGFHVYGCYWNAATIGFYVDGDLTIEHPNEDWDQALDLLVSIGMARPLVPGSVPESQPGAPTDEGFPTRAEIDWVRAWQRRLPAPGESTTLMGPSLRTVWQRRVALVDAGQGWVYLDIVRHPFERADGPYLWIDSTGTLREDATSPSDAAKFRLEDAGNGTVAIRSFSTGEYLWFPSRTTTAVAIDTPLPITPRSRFKFTLGRVPPGDHPRDHKSTVHREPHK